MLEYVFVVILSVLMLVSKDFFAKSFPSIISKYFLNKIKQIVRKELKHVILEDDLLSKCLICSISSRSEMLYRRRFVDGFSLVIRDRFWQKIKSKWFMRFSIKILEYYNAGFLRLFIKSTNEHIEDCFESVKMDCCTN